MIWIWNAVLKREEITKQVITKVRRNTLYKNNKGTTGLQSFDFYRFRNIDIRIWDLEIWAPSLKDC